MLISVWSSDVCSSDLDGRCGARDQTLRGEHRHARVTLHRPAVAWIQYMAVASTVDREAAFVITARGDRAGGHLQRRDRLLRLLRMTHADPPRRTVTDRKSTRLNSST